VALSNSDHGSDGGVSIEVDNPHVSSGKAARINYYIYLYTISVLKTYNGILKIVLIWCYIAA
jgi:hypothetical protein